MRNLMQKCHSLRVAVRREKDQAFEVFKQKYRNLEADLSHAHAIEFHQPAEIGAIQAQRSRSMQSSTFRGTLKYAAQQCPRNACTPPLPSRRHGLSRRLHIDRVYGWCMVQVRESRRHKVRRARRVELATHSPRRVEAVWRVNSPDSVEAAPPITQWSWPSYARRRPPRPKMRTRGDQGPTTSQSDLDSGELLAVGVIGLRLRHVRWCVDGESGDCIMGRCVGWLRRVAMGFQVFLRRLLPTRSSTVLSTHLEQTIDENRRVSGRPRVSRAICYLVPID